MSGEAERLDGPVEPQDSARLTEIAPGPPDGSAEVELTEIAPGPPAQAQPTVTADLPPPPDELEPGLRINQYELIRPLGRGGMGQVFLARDIRLGRKVAIKFLNAPSARVARRFLVEARATARCSHENIVVIHEVNEHQGRPFMVLEHLEGEPLTGYMRGRRLPAAHAVEHIVQVVRALARAHEFNIIHRDLKPDNIFVLETGMVKVLDFGIAKVLGEPGAPGAPAAGEPSAEPAQPGGDAGLTEAGARLGTMQYMAPEQWGEGEIDARADIWAVGLILYEMVAGEHPYAGLGPMQLMTQAALVEEPVRPVGTVAPEIPSALEAIIERCLAKRREERFGCAAELLAALEPLLPANLSRKLGEDVCPYPGLASFEEADAGRFFGRAREVARAGRRLRERPLVGVVGPSGVGKSSFVRAGVIPALREAGEQWEVFVTRPGRTPMASLASLLQPITRSSSSDLRERAAEHEALQRRLRQEPGHLGALLREHARQKGASVLLFVDQFEELYTLVPDPAERAAFTACLGGVADDAATPLRVVVAMRSDLLDRAAEDPDFVAELTRGLIFLQTPDREGLQEAITQPLEMAGFRFETPGMVAQMLDDLEATPGALPLMQFAVSRLWEARDRQWRLLAEGSFRAMGGVAGVLSTHADATLVALPAPDQRTARAIFQRLVTSDGTRAIVDISELLELPAGPGEVQRVVDYLVQARLLVVQTRSDAEGPAVELVHESLIQRWSTLRRWIDEDKEAAAFLEHLRNTSRQWRAKGRPQGLLWTGDAEQEARFWSRKVLGELPALEREYLDAVFMLRARTRRRRRALLGAAFVALALIALGAVIASLQISRAEEQAVDKARQARQAERRVKEQLELVQRKERARLAAERAKQRAEAAVNKGRARLATAQTKLRRSYAELERALRRAEAEKARALSAQAAANKLAESESRARSTTERLLARERGRLLKLKRRITTELR